ncbi:S-layer homology domain-containing protein [Paenibacillus pedocola]|uniref:S-layer homology domain-containing protein n=1 Tax=Paenibacillus pedocola TaxID=3242193 RepID=UPI002877B1E8|nr:S-layer homology domain-containing protein [Paenibacillus typhae]
MIRPLKAKKILSLLLAASLLVLPVHAAKAEAAESAEAILSSVPAGQVSQYNYFNNVYEHLNDENHVFKTATYEDIVHLFESEGNYAVLVGGAWSENTQADIGFINEVAKEYGVSTIYNFDTKLDGETLNIADSTNKYAYKYVDLVNKYLKNLSLYDKNDPGHNVSYVNKAGETVTANKIDSPFLFIYNKDHVDASGNKAPIVSYLNESKSWSDFQSSGSLDAAKVNAYKAQLRQVFGSVTAYSVVDESAYIKAAFNRNYEGENPGKPTIFNDSDGTLVFEHVTYHQLKQILASEGNYAVLLGGSWCPNTQAIIKYINEYAKKYNIDKIYFFDTKLDAGVTVAEPDNNSGTKGSANPHNNNELQIRTTNHAYAKLYVDLVKTYLTNIKTENNTAATPSVISYVDANGNTVTGDRLQVPYLFTYNKDNKDTDGNSAPILGHVELMYGWENIQPTYVDTKNPAYAVGARYNNAVKALNSLFSRLEAVPAGLSGVSPTSAAGSDGQITGTLNKALEYRSVADAVYTAVTGVAITGLAPGTYVVRYASKPGYQGPTTVDGATAIAYKAGLSVSVEVPAYGEQAAPSGLAGIAPTTPENKDGRITGTTTALEYKLSTVTDYVYATDVEITGLIPGTYQVRYAAKEGYNSGRVTEVVVPAYTAEQAAPTGLTGIAPSTSANKDGRITGTTQDQEYKLATATSYVYASDKEITGLIPGTYNVRYAAKEGYKAGKSADVIVPEYTAPSGGNNSSSGGGTSAPVVNTGPAVTTSGNTVTAVTKAATTTDESTGVTTATLTAAEAEELAKSAKQAETEGKQAVLEIEVAASAQTQTAELTLPRSAFNAITDSTNAVIRINYLKVGTITFDAKSAATISGAADAGDITITIAKVSLNDEGKAVLGDRPVYDLTVKAGDSAVADFGGGKVKISVAYTLHAGEDAHAVIVYYITASGNLETVRGNYQAASSSVDFVTTHFSQYIIGYNKITFADVAASSWYSEAVGYLAARSITSGTDGNNYSPNAALTRGQFVVLLLKAYGIAPENDGAANFTDAGTSYYSNYLAAAKRLGIATGSGNNQFKPDNQITRQELFTLLYRSLTILGELPEGTGNTALSGFSDASQVAGYAEEALQALIAGGIIEGNNGKLDPQGISTRAQAAQVIFNLLER